MEGFCRGCLIRYDDPMEMLQYSEKYRRLFVYSTGLQVKRNDIITFQLCKDCFLTMKASCKFKKSCRASDKKLKSYLALKDVENGVDFCTFLKNNDDTMAFRLPLMSGSSTPAQQNKSRDDDNDSTCTSIRNFMTDILQGEEMPDTEARIIREVIEEEADVLDESLDSHWLEDDVSIDDFRLDFSLSPFATPNSINNDHCYTPKRLGEPKEEQIRKYFTSISPARQHKHVNDFTDMIRNNQSEKELCIISTEEVNNEIPVNNFDMPIIENENAVNHSDLSNIKNQKSINSFDLPIIHNEKSINNFDLAISDREKSINNLDFPIIDNEKSINNLSSPVMEEEKSMNALDFPIIDNQKPKNNLTLPIIEEEKSINNLDYPIIDTEKSINNLNLPIIEEEKSLNNLDLSSIPSIDTEQSINNFDFPINDNEKYINSLDLPSFDSEKSLNNLDLPSLPSIDNDRSINNLDLPMVDNDNGNYDQGINTPNFYVPTDGTAYITASKEIERIIDAKKFEKDKPCSIDKNLEKALENKNNNEFSLDDLLVSPQVFHEASGASTPTITNILFGDKVNLNKISTYRSPEYVEQNGKIDTVIFEKFFQDDFKELHTDDKKEIADDKDVFKVPMAVDEVDHGTRKTNKKYKFSSDFDEKMFDLETFVCNICNKKFGSSKAISIHAVKKHNIIIIKPKSFAYNYKPKICNLCGREYRNLQNFHRHLKKHKNKPEQEVFKCDICSLEFRAKSNLDKHKRSHSRVTVEKVPGKYVCSVCGATSTTIGNFRVHQRRHTTNFRHICKECGKGFHRLSDFTVHMRLHTGERPFPCKYCDSTFSRKHALTIHMKLHIDNKPYQCEHCDIAFAARSQLTRHLKVAKRCKQIRGIAVETMIVENRKGETKTNEIEIEDEPKDIDEEKNDAVEYNDVISSQLPYIDTEYSN